MTSTLPFLDQLLLTARRMHDAGRTNDAFKRFIHLSRLGELPAEMVAECHLRMGEMLRRRGKPNRARKHLKTVLRHCPDHARAHQLLGDAWSAGTLPDPYAALEHYRKSLALAPDQTDCLCAAGKLAVEQGMSEEGLEYLRKAAELGADNPDVMRKVVDGMLLASQAEGVRRLLQAALFRNHRDRRFRAVWDHFQFQQARQTQGEARARNRRDVVEGPVILTFERSAKAPEMKLGGKKVRVDGPASLSGPHREAVVARLPRHRVGR